MGFIAGTLFIIMVNWTEMPQYIVSLMSEDARHIHEVNKHYNEYMEPNGWRSQ